MDLIYVACSLPVEHSHFTLNYIGCAECHIKRLRDVYQQSRLNRFYASTKGGYLMKTRDGSEGHLLKSSGVMIYNTNKEDFPNDVNYKFYINKCKEIITELHNLNQLQLF